MPLIKEFDWKFKWVDHGKAFYKINIKEAVLGVLENAELGRYSFKWFQERLLISRRNWNRVVKDIRDGDTLFAKRIRNA